MAKNKIAFSRGFEPRMSITKSPAKSENYVSLEEALDFLHTEEAFPAQPKIAQPKIAQPKIAQPKIVQPKIVQPKIVQPKIVQPKEPINPKAPIIVSEKQANLMLKKPSFKALSWYPDPPEIQHTFLKRLFHNRMRKRMLKKDSQLEQVFKHNTAYTHKAFLPFVLLSPNRFRRKEVRSVKAQQYCC